MNTKIRYKVLTLSNDKLGYWPLFIGSKWVTSMNGFSIWQHSHHNLQFVSNNKTHVTWWAPKS